MLHFRMLQRVLLLMPLRRGDHLPATVAARALQRSKISIESLAIRTPVLTA